MTPEEQKVMADLVSAWNGFVALPRQHGDELNEFRHALHDLQRIVMVRQVSRMKL